LARAEANQETGRSLAVEQAAGSEGVQPASLCAIHLKVSDGRAALWRVLLARDPLTRDPGTVRTVQNWIGGNDDI
jgi:hypothetical protein